MTGKPLLSAAELEDELTDAISGAINGVVDGLNEQQRGSSGVFVVIVSALTTLIADTANGNIRDTDDFADDVAAVLKRQLADMARPDPAHV